MMSPFRTPAPPDDSAELAEIEEWLMQLPAPPGHRAPTTKPTAWTRSFARICVGLYCGAHAAAFLALLIATPTAPGLIVVDAMYAAIFVLASPWGARRLARRKMRRAGLLPPKR